jgi:glycosyltransferase involved in cell wall biosynthesis
MTDENETTSRVDLHCHSTASAVAKLGVQSALGLPECATPPEEVYALAKRRGMDFVTITDHDTIDGALAIADRPDVFVSEELTVGFRGEPQQVHVLSLGITPDDHEWLQAHRDDVEVVATYLHEREITCALAHPFYAVAAPLTPRHRRRLAELFGIWEVRNGARDAELNAPAAIYIETHGGTGIGGTDDHAGIDIGRTYSETPAAATPAAFLAHVRAGRVRARGDQGSAARWAHNAMALAVRALGRGAADGAAPPPAAVLRMVERVMSDADARGGAACRVSVLYAGRLTREKGVDLLADAFLAGRARDPRLHLVLAGGGPEEERLRTRLGRAATFLGWLDGAELAVAYASADLFLFCSQTDTFGQVVLEAQASGLPVVAAAAGGPAELIADGRSGLLCAPRPQALAGAVAGLAGSRAMRERLARGGLAAVRDRSWEASLGRLAAGWRRALATDGSHADRLVA